jgi:hypothetical protein
MPVSGNIGKALGEICGETRRGFSPQIFGKAPDFSTAPFSLFCDARTVSASPRWLQAQEAGQRR